MAQKKWSNPKGKKTKTLSTYDKVPRFKKFKGNWYILSDISFNIKNAKESLKTANRVYGNGKLMKYKHKSGSIEYATYVKNPKGKYGENPRK